MVHSTKSSWLYMKSFEFLSKIITNKLSQTLLNKRITQSQMYPHTCFNSVIHWNKHCLSVTLYEIPRVQNLTLHCVVKFQQEVWKLLLIPTHLSTHTCQIYEKKKKYFFHLVSRKCDDDCLVFIFQYLRWQLSVLGECLSPFFFP